MKLIYRELGAGPPMILLHGLFGSSDNWLTMAKELSQFRHIYLLDQRNHGQSPHSTEFTYEAMADDLYEFVKDHHLERPDVLGHSMGGKTAMTFAAKYPEHIGKLIVVDIAPKYYPVHHQQILAGLFNIKLDELKSRGAADEALSQFVSTLTTRQFLLKNLKRSPDGFEWKINLQVIADQIENVGEPLSGSSRIETPTCFIRVSESDYILDADFPDIEKQFSNVTIETISDAGHWIHAEQPAALCRTIESFLNG